MFPENSRIIRLDASTAIKPFDCEDVDLNAFLMEDAKGSLSELLTVTYILENHNETVAFWSLLNDKIVKREVDSFSWSSLWDRMPDGKKYSSYPAMKIGRLGVSKNFKGKKIGTAILDHLKVKFIQNNRTGCKFITVDAYRQSLGFYSKNGFVFFKDSAKSGDSHTCQMYFDLLPLTKSMNQAEDDDDSSR